MAAPILAEASGVDPVDSHLVVDDAFGRPQEARAQYEAALTVQPDYAPALVGLGVLLAGSGDTAGAERALRRALEVDPTQAEARFDLAEVLARQGRQAEAAAEYARVRDAEAAPPEIRSRARARLQAAGP